MMITDRSNACYRMWRSKNTQKKDGCYRQRCKILFEKGVGKQKGDPKSGSQKCINLI